MPQNVVSSALAADRVTLTWGAVTGATGYQVEVSPALAAPIPATTATSQVITGLAANTAYTLTVKAKNAEGTLGAASTAVSVTTPAPTDRITIGGARYRAGDRLEIRTGTQQGVTVRVYNGAVGDKSRPIGTATITNAVAPATGITWDLRLRNNAVPAGVTTLWVDPPWRHRRTGHPHQVTSSAQEGPVTYPAAGPSAVLRPDRAPRHTATRQALGLPHLRATARTAAPAATPAPGAAGPRVRARVVAVDDQVGRRPDLHTRPAQPGPGPPARRAQRVGHPAACSAAISSAIRPCRMPPPASVPAYTATPASAARRTRSRAPAYSSRMWAA